MGGTFNPGLRNNPVTSIVNKFSAGSGDGNANLGQRGMKVALSGALDAATYKEMLNVSGAGAISLCMTYAVDATSRTLGLKIVIDGVTVYDCITAACTMANGANVGIGGVVTADNPEVIMGQPVYFLSSLVVSIKWSLAETNKIGLGYRYILT